MKRPFDEVLKGLKVDAIDWEGVIDPKQALELIRRFEALREALARAHEEESRDQQLKPKTRIQFFRVPDRDVPSFAFVGSERHTNLMGDESVEPLNIFLEEP